MVDTGAEVSVIPPSRTGRKHPQQGFNLQAVNYTTIITYGCRSLTRDLGLRHTFRWIFIITDVQNPILDADFLRNYTLLVDMRHNRLLDSLTQLKVQGIVSQEPSLSPTFPVTQPTNKFEAILSNPSWKLPCQTQHNSSHHNYWPASQCTPLMPFSRRAQDSPSGV